MFNPDAPENYGMGLFHYLEFGVFIATTQYSVIYFSGLHRHGGTAPTAPKGEEPSPSAYRFTVVCYPNYLTARGCGPTAFGPLAAGDRVLIIPPEMRHRLP